MAKKKCYKEIKVKSLTAEEMNAVMANKSSNIEDKIATYCIRSIIIDKAKAANEELLKEIEDTSMSTILGDLVARGLILTDEDPKFVITDDLGIKLDEKISKSFTVEKKMDDIMDIVPDTYKKVTVDYNKKALQDAFEKGTLESILKPYVSLTSKTVTRMSKYAVKKKKEDA